MKGFCLTLIVPLHLHRTITNNILWKEFLIMIFFFFFSSSKTIELHEMIWTRLSFLKRYNQALKFMKQIDSSIDYQLSNQPIYLWVKWKFPRHCMTYSSNYPTSPSPVSFLLLLSSSHSLSHTLRSSTFFLLKACRSNTRIQYQFNLLLYIDLPISSHWMLIQHTNQIIKVNDSLPKFKQTQMLKIIGFNCILKHIIFSAYH